MLLRVFDLGVSGRTKKKVDPVLEAGLINKLYAWLYSLTFPVFEKFCQTQKTKNYHHFHDLESHLVMLNETSAIFIEKSRA